MSRRIVEKKAVTISEEEIESRKTDAGKLIFTGYHERDCVLLLKGNKLFLAAFPEESQVGTVYLAKVIRVVKNISACFVETTPGTICFLSFRDAEFPFLMNRRFDGRILEGDELMVQVTRDAQKTKQSSVSAHVSLSGDYFALTFGPGRVGYSAKLAPDDRKALEAMLRTTGIVSSGNSEEGFSAGLSRELLSQLPPEMPSATLIVRTKAAELIGNGAERLTERFKEFWNQCAAFFQNAIHRTCFSCLRENGPADNMIAGVLNHLVSPDEFSELLTDSPSMYTRLEEYRSVHIPEKKLRLYEDSMLSLSKLYNLDSGIEEALGERVWLKSGGYLMIQPTEALTVIDVNSGKYEGKRDAFLRVNLEAAEEIARQLRLRNLSGIIIVDFINMKEEESRAEVMDSLKKYVRRDKVKTTVVDMTPLGLVEITRKKITKPLREALAD